MLRLKATGRWIGAGAVAGTLPSRCCAAPQPSPPRRAMPASDYVHEAGFVSRRRRPGTARPTQGTGPTTACSTIAHLWRWLRIGRSRRQPSRHVDRHRAPQRIAARQPPASQRCEMLSGAIMTRASPMLGGSPACACLCLPVPACACWASGSVVGLQAAATRRSRADRTTSALRVDGHDVQDAWRPARLVCTCCPPSSSSRGDSAPSYHHPSPPPTPPRLPCSHAAPRLASVPAAFPVLVLTRMLLATGSARSYIFPAADCPRAERARSAAGPGCVRCDTHAFRRLEAPELQTRAFSVAPSATAVIIVVAPPSPSNAKPTDCLAHTDCSPLRPCTGRLQRPSGDGCWPTRSDTPAHHRLTSVEAAVARPAGGKRQEVTSQTSRGCCYVPV